MSQFLVYQQITATITLLCNPVKLTEGSNFKYNGKGKANEIISTQAIQPINLNQTRIFSCASNSRSALVTLSVCSLVSHTRFLMLE
jgi:hypothetical protein